MLARVVSEVATAIRRNLETAVEAVGPASALKTTNTAGIAVEGTAGVATVAVVETGRSLAVEAGLAELRLQSLRQPRRLRSALGDRRRQLRRHRRPQQRPHPRPHPTMEEAVAAAETLALARAVAATVAAPADVAGDAAAGLARPEQTAVVAEGAEGVEEVGEVEVGG